MKKIKEFLSTPITWGASLKWSLIWAVIYLIWASIYWVYCLEPEWWVKVKEFVKRLFGRKPKEEV